MNYNYFSYEELCANALSAHATDKDINDLGEWFERYGRMYWNGECYEIDSTHNLYPIWHYVGDDDIEISGFPLGLVP